MSAHQCACWHWHAFWALSCIPIPDDNEVWVRSRGVIRFLWAPPSRRRLMGCQLVDSESPGVGNLQQLRVSLFDRATELLVHDESVSEKRPAVEVS